MDPPENLRVQPGLQLVESPVIRCSRDLPSHNTNRIFREGGIDDLVGLDQHEPLADPDGDLVAPGLPAGHHFDDLLQLIVRGRGAPRAWTLRLDPDVFWRVHRSHLVNINKIKEIVPWFSRNYILRMKDARSTEIPVSRAQTKRLREYLKL